MALSNKLNSLDRTVRRVAVRRLVGGGYRATVIVAGGGSRRRYVGDGPTPLDAMLAVSALANAGEGVTDA